MENTQKRHVRAVVLKRGYNMYSSTVSLGEPFQPESDMMQHDEFIGNVIRHWSESVDNGLEGMKRAEY